MAKWSVKWSESIHWLVKLELQEVIIIVCKGKIVPVHKHHAKWRKEVEIHNLISSWRWLVGFVLQYLYHWEKAPSIH